MNSMPSIRRTPARVGLAIAAVALSLAFVPAASTVVPAFAQAADVTVDPQSVSIIASDLRAGFALDPSKTETREPLPGITVYEADYTREQTPANFKDGPIEIKSLVARTASAQQATEQLASSRQALLTANPAWTESKVAKIGDEAVGLSMKGTSSAGPAVAHLYLFRRGAMVVGITVAGLEKPTKMAESEALAATVLLRMDPIAGAQRGQVTTRPLNAKPTGSPAPAASPSASGSTGSASSGTKMQVAKTDRQGVRLRAQPSRTASIAGTLPEGTIVEIVGEDRQADGITWKNVRAPGDGRGWVSGEYLVPAPSGAGSISANAGATPTAAASPAPTGGTATGSAATATPATSAPSASPAPSADTLTVDVSLAKTELRDGEQTLTVKVSQQGKPVSGAIPTIRTTRDEQPTAVATDADGTSTVTWSPSGDAGFVGVGVSVTTASGASGVGSTYFNLLASR